MVSPAIHWDRGVASMAHRSVVQRDATALEHEGLPPLVASSPSQTLVQMPACLIPGAGRSFSHTRARDSALPLRSTVIIKRCIPPTALHVAMLIRGVRNLINPI